MGWLRDVVLGPGGGYEPPAGAETFAVDAEAVPPEVFGLQSYSDPIAHAPRIDRRTAIQCTPVKRSRDLIAGVIGTLPLSLYDSSSNQLSSTLFEQPERHRPRSVTMTETVEHMLFEKTAWWRKTEVDSRGWPLFIKVLHPRDVTVDEDNDRVYVKGKEVDQSELIRFDSPNDALLVAGARAIRTCLLLDSAAANNADGVPALEYFTPADGQADPADDDDIIELLEQYAESRRKRSRAYIPAALKLNTGGFNPKDLQLAEAREHAVLEIARAAGVDPEAVGVSTTSRTYFNAEHKRKEFVDFTLGGYLVAIEGRLSMGDVTPRGQYARFVLDAFLRSDTKTRMETYEIGKRVGAYTEDEIRELEDRPPLTAEQRPVSPPAELRALPSRQEAS